MASSTAPKAGASSSLTDREMLGFEDPDQDVDGADAVEYLASLYADLVIHLGQTDADAADAEKWRKLQELPREERVAVAIMAGKD